jgi:hypothetical protein
MVGCVGTIDTSKLGNFNFPNVNNDVNVKEVRGLFGKIDASLKGATKDDCLFLATMYFGLSEYLKHAKGVTTTQQIAPPGGLTGVIAADYGWTAGKYPEFTKLLADDMESTFKLSEPKKIDDALRTGLIEAYSVYGEGCRRVAGRK